jgi:hypothetical protein
MDETSLGGLLADVATKHRASTDRIGRIVQLLDGSARKHAVLVEARTALSRRLEDQPERLAELWSSIEQVATASDATQYTPTAYGAQLGHAGERAVVMQGDLPPELEAWMNTLGADRIRDLTLTLLLDLLALDPTDAQADGIIADLGEAAEDLLAAGDHEAVLTIVERLTATHGTRAIGHRAAAGSLQRLATGTALQEASLLLDAMPADGYDHFRRICVALGPSAVDALRQYLTVARPDSGRLVEILQALGDAAIARLAPVVHHPDPETHVRLARLLGRVGSAACVPLLETLARGGNRQVSAEATRNLLAIGDPRSAGLVREILRTSNAERRSAILAAIAAGEAADSAPLLVQVLSDCDALRDDHALALDLLGSLRQLGDRQTVTDVVHNGDRQLRRLARAALQRVEDAAPTGAEETT